MPYGASSVASSLNSVGTESNRANVRAAALLEGGVVLADLLLGTVVGVQQHGQLEAEPVHPGGVDVDGRRAHGELDEVEVRAVRRAEVEVHPAGRVRGHVNVRLLGDRLGLPAESSEDLAVRVLAVRLVDDGELEYVVRRGDSADVAPERRRRLAVAARGFTVQVNDAEPEAPVVSVAVTVTVEVPVAVGVPEISRVLALMDSPAGSPVAQ